MSTKNESGAHPRQSSGISSISIEGKEELVAAAQAEVRKRNARILDSQRKNIYTLALVLVTPTKVQANGTVTNS